ncbi:cytochrome P450 [Rhodocollybia butyracea]|uniref:Cytochrome P450 n=1 Tax=Rhodocollybia butyracea TaxID=206335 RepID=A0A9P5PZB8_9AGAR|nr:cytochrome P450 [Rhodocollybia butyracea]
MAASIRSLFYRSFKVRGISLTNELPGPPSQSWFKGNHEQLFGLKDGWEFHKTLAEQYGPAVQIKGFLGSNQFYTFDLKAMHYILVKEASSFSTLLRLETSNLLFGNGLIPTHGEQHRKQRKMLNPVFSIAHMRMMMPIFYDVTDQLEMALLQRVQSEPKEIDILGWMARTALELIGRSGFGYSFDNFIDNAPTHRYSIVIKELFPSLAGLSFADSYILPLGLKLLPTNIRTFIMNLTPWKTLHDVRDMINYMHKLSVEIYQEKKCALEEGDGAVASLLSILIKENMKADNEDKLEEEELIAQMSTFIFAATDTTSNGLSRILHLLAKNQEIQERMRREITEARKQCQDSRLSYDELVALPYLDAVCRETLRLYPPAPILLRRCTEDIVIPLSRPVRGKNGNNVTQIFLPKGTRTVISVLNTNRSAELWGPDVLEWKPERWLSPLPGSITEAPVPGIYANLMTFGGGSRSCIGFKFSQLEMKVVISMLIEHFEFSLPSDKGILWQMATVVSPIVEGSHGNSEMPLMMRSAR